MAIIGAFCEWLNNTAISVNLRENDWPFPIIETIHILGLAVSVGVVFWIDLRLIGLIMRQEPMSDVVGQLEPWAVRGFSIMFLSGLLLFVSEPLYCYNAPAFRVKLVLVALAGLNVWFFHNRVYKYMTHWDEGPSLPWRARMVGFLSLVLWFGVIAAGRWTAYK
jgi:Family of unknown function (DUF6644)